MPFQDVAAERAVLAGICRYGIHSYYDVADLITANSFTIESNQILYSCLEHIFVKEEKSIVDLASILSAAQFIGVNEFLSNKQEMQHISSIIKFPVDQSNIRKFARTIAKLETAKKIYDQLEITREKYLGVTGQEPMSTIFGIAEESIFDFMAALNGSDDNPQKLFDGIEEYLDQLTSNKTDQVGISTGFARYDFAIGGGLRRGTVNVIGARPKALAYGSKVYTPNGPINIEDVKVGDIVLHPFKGETKVTHVWDHKNIDIYRIHFRDGDYVDCCEDHLWHVYKRYPYNNQKQYLKSTKELINDLAIGNKNMEYKWDIPLPNPIIYRDRPINIDPYVLGVLLGDGSVANGTCCYHTADDEIHNYMLNYFNSLGLDVKFESKKSKATTWRVNGFQNELRKAGIFGHNCYNKFIPKDYIYNSIDVRLNILAGLLDTDGDCTIDKRSRQSRTRFCSVSYQLCLDVKEIVHSLGGLCSINKQTVNMHTAYRCEIRLPSDLNPFKLSRKADRFTNRKIGKLKRTIIKIEKIRKDNARCITLEDNDGLFMTDNYIVTHNTGKTLLAQNMGMNIARKNIPVLDLDTEMRIEDFRNRALASETMVPIDAIETGKFEDDTLYNRRILNKIEALRGVPYYHINIAGKSFEDQLAIMRRWIARNVGLNKEGKANQCVIIYDYLKLMNSADIKDMAEFQALGFMMTSLHNFAIKYDVPILSFIQLNRDGITKESTDAASGSDRIIWLCSNFTIYKVKADEEIAQDGPDNGNRKLVPIIARHGQGLEDKDYINVIMQGKFANLKEGKTAKELSEGGNYIDESDEEDELISKDIPF